MPKNSASSTRGTVDWEKVNATTDADVQKHAVQDHSQQGAFSRSYSRVIGLPTPDLAALRSRLGLSQAQFANKFGFSLRTLQQWEQGRAEPDQPARLLLKLIEHSPRQMEAEVETLLHPQKSFSPLISGYHIDIEPDRRVNLEILNLNQRIVVEIFYRMRPSHFTAATDQYDAAVQQWLIYLSMLVDVSASAVIHLACYRQHVAASAHLRMCIEYAARALFFDRHPEEAWFEQKYAIKRSYFVVTKEVPDQDAAATIEPIYKDALKECPDLSTKRRPKTMKHILHVLTGSHDFYYREYGAHSELVHGSAAGMDQLFVSESDGVVAGRIEYSPEEFNAELLLLAGYVISFCEVFIKRFDQPYQEQLEVFKAAYDRLSSGFLD